MGEKFAKWQHPSRESERFCADYLSRPGSMHTMHFVGCNIYVVRNCFGSCTFQRQAMFTTVVVWLNTDLRSLQIYTWSICFIWCLSMSNWWHQSHSKQLVSVSYMLPSDIQYIWWTHIAVTFVKPVNETWNRIHHHCHHRVRIHLKLSKWFQSVSSTVQVSRHGLERQCIVEAVMTWLEARLLKHGNDRWT